MIIKRTGDGDTVTTIYHYLNNPLTRGAQLKVEHS